MTEKENSASLLKYRANLYSHNGEDGVIEYLCSKLPQSNKWAIEFGAWDGKFSSNTCKLLEKNNFNVIFIEADAKKFEDLKANHASNSRAHLVLKYIGLSSQEGLDHILSQIKDCPRDPDLISMDIDGCEYHIWDQLKIYAPKILLVEFNPSIPIHYSYIQKADFTVQHASSIKAFVNLGKSKGYTLVSILDYNAIFLRDELVDQMEIIPATTERLFAPFFEKYQTQIWQSMDGKIHLIGCDRLLWHNVSISEKKLQILPKLMQFNPAGDGFLRNCMRKIYYNLPYAPQVLNFLISGQFKKPVQIDKISRNSKQS